MIRFVLSPFLRVYLNSFKRRVLQQWRAKIPVEPLLVEDSVNSRLMLFPLDPRYTSQGSADLGVWERYKQHLACFWPASEVDLSCDLKDYKSLTADEQHYIKHTLAFFACSDSIVNINVAKYLCDIKSQEVLSFYGFQTAIENIHTEMYNLLIDTYVSNPDEKKGLFNAVNNVASIRGKADWAFNYIDNGSFAERLVAFAAVEGIFFSGSFCSIFWLKKRGLMPGLTFSNELISRDEGMHRDFACHLYRHHIKRKLPPRRVWKIISDAVRQEKIFVTEALPVNLLGINATLMCEYIEFVANHLLASLGIPGEDTLGPLRFKADNPFPWMEMISLEGKTNFFEKKVGEYQIGGVMNSKEENVFDLDADF
jgi:ribonucleoside-diphosphate reductase beta chain